jgi:hypothetical protein
MAVRNEYINTNLAAGTLQDATIGGGGNTQVITQTFEIAAADDDASIFRLARIKAGDILLRATIMCDAITGGTDYDLGLYQISQNGVAGAVLDKDIFMDGQTFASATKTIDGLQTVAIENRVKPVLDLHNTVNSASVANSGQEYDIALTANTIGTAAGTVTVILEVLKKG